MLPVPRLPSGLTPEWASRALQDAFPGAVVSRVQVTEVAEGTNRRARLRLTYSQPAGGPPSLFVKLPGRPLHRLALLALRAWDVEARLARSGIQLGCEHARFIAAGYETRTLSSVVVMEDVAERGGLPNGATGVMTIAETASGLAELAKLHGRYWERDLLDSEFLRPWRLGALWAPVSYASLRNGLRRLGRLGHRALVGELDTAMLERQFRRSASLAATGPQTLLHGDPHPGNTFGLPGERTGFYDWQLVRTGNWSHDVGYFVIGALSVDDRRAHEHELIEGYLGGLRGTGVTTHLGLPSPSEAWLRYRAAPAFGLATWLHTLSLGSFQPEDASLETISRFATAYLDLGTRYVL